jgi:glycosyltransferase involved in cell wall biosynthesis
MKKVSVIIPTYNMGNFILKSINSLLNQTYKNIEIIIIDDGSTDNTYKIIKQIKKKNIKYIRQNNKKNSAARNTGIKNAKGEYIIFLDADDDLPLKSIEYRVKFLENNKNVDCVYGKTAYINKNNKIRCIKQSKQNIKPLDFFTAGKVPFIPMTLMYRKKIFKKIGLFDETIFRSQDADFCYRCIINLNINGINKIVYNYHKYSHTFKKRIYFNFLQFKGKIKSINKNIKGVTKYYLIISNTLFFPIKLIHQLVFFNK